MAEPNTWTTRVRGWLSVGAGHRPGRAADLDDLAERLLAARRPLVVAGSGVVDGDAVPGLRALAAEARVGVYNTWRAKGVLPWDSDYHLGTIGLQARDLELCALETYDLILTTGLVDGEPPAPAEALARAAADQRSDDATGHAPGDGPADTAAGAAAHGAESAEAADAGPVVVDCPVEALEILAVRCADREGPATTEAPLRDRLAAVVQKAWGGASPPLAPTLITRQYALLLGERGMVAADAGTAGFYLGRTFPTLRPRTVELPATPTPGFAAAAVVARREAEPDLPALALVDGDRPDDATRAVVEAAAARGIAVPVVCWSPGGPSVGIEDHLNEVRKAVADAEPVVIVVGYDPSQLDELERVAGHITAW